jgi:putative sterol carrier protein
MSSVDRLFQVLSAYFAHSSKPAAALAKKINAVYQFVLDNGAKKFIIDLKKGEIREGEDANADCTFTMKSEDFLSLAAGKLNPQTAFMTGKLKIKGSIGIAMKFTPNVFPKIDAKLLADSTKTAEQVVASVLSAKL